RALGGAARQGRDGARRAAARLDVRARRRDGGRSYAGRASRLVGVRRGRRGLGGRSQARDALAIRSRDGCRCVRAREGRRRGVPGDRENRMKFVSGLTCHLCGKTYPPEALWVCSECLGPLEVSYDYDAVRSVMTRERIESRPRSLWRYQELLPVTEPKTGFYSGFTPLVRAHRLARELGVAELYIKDDSVN